MEQKIITINVYNTVGNEFCAEVDDGQQVYKLIVKALKAGKKVKLSFQNVRMLTPTFLHVAIGQLYRGDFKEEKIKNNLTVENMPPEDIKLLKRVIETAKLYYKNPEKMQKSINEILEEK